MQHQSRKYNIEAENVTKIENATPMRIIHSKDKKRKNADVLKLNSRQLIRYLKIEIAALK